MKVFNILFIFSVETYLNANKTHWVKYFYGKILQFIIFGRIRENKLKLI